MSSTVKKIQHAMTETLPQATASLEDKLIATVRAHLKSVEAPEAVPMDRDASTVTPQLREVASHRSLMSVARLESLRVEPAAPEPLHGPVSSTSQNETHVYDLVQSEFPVGVVHALSPSSSMDDLYAGARSATSDSPGRLPAAASSTLQAHDHAPMARSTTAPTPTRRPPPAPPKKDLLSIEKPIAEVLVPAAPRRHTSQSDRRGAAQTAQRHAMPYYPVPQHSVPSLPPSHPTLNRQQSQVDWIVPTAVRPPDPTTRDTVSRRLGFTIDIAKKRHASLQSHAKLVGRALNAAIGLQIVVGALITGLAAVTTGRQTSIMTSILSAASTIIGAYLARMRGTGEPDLSKSRAKGWEKFLRSCEAYIVDHGDEPARDHMDRVIEFREEFEKLEGSANAEQKGNNV